MSGCRQGDADAGREGEIRRHTYGTLGQQGQRRGGNDPTGDLPAAARWRYAAGSVAAGSRLDRATVRGAHAGVFAEAQPQAGDDGDDDGVSGQ